MTREERFMPNGVPKKVRIYDNGGRIYDNGGKTYDRYTAVFIGNYKGRDGCDYLGMSEYPFHPQGFGQHGWSREIIDYPSYRHLGRKITFDKLPEQCQKLVIQDYKEIWNIG